MNMDKKIKAMAEGGRKLSEIFNQLVSEVQVGVNLLAIEKTATDLIKQSGGYPAFKRVPGYRWSTCLNLNEGVVHGVPKDLVLKENDLLTIDIGLFYKGFNTDMSGTIKVQSSKFKVQSEETDRFLAVGKKALKEAIKEAKPGNRVGHISLKIQEIIEKKGYNCVRSLTGHAIGQKLHEKPSIPCFLRGKISETEKLKEGMTLAIEVIYTAGSYELVTSKDDGWTIKTRDGKMAAVFEETITVSRKPVILTPRLITG